MNEPPHCHLDQREAVRGGHGLDDAHRIQVPIADIPLAVHSPDERGFPRLLRLSRLVLARQQPPRQPATISVRPPNHGVCKTRLTRCKSRHPAHTADTRVSTRSQSTSLCPFVSRTSCTTTPIAHTYLSHYNTPDTRSAAPTPSPDKSSQSRQPQTPRNCSAPTS